ncbi:MAG TPA: hypothetical protein VKC64_05520 [Burkholderiales bacterium]|nr:hypothetical protein [Burkholderiales bacterium]
MRLDDLRAHYWARRGTDHAFDSVVQEFLTVAAQTRFEMRYIGEDRWYPAPTDDVAVTLASYHPDLQQCLDRMLTGEVVASRLAHFRVAFRQTRI